MKCSLLLFLTVFILVSGSAQGPQQTLRVAGLKKAVQITRDEWGVNHIKAQNEEDLFFAQGYAAARDRLFQFELWRLQATGTLSSVFGSRMVKRDAGARLFRFRGDLDKELAHYHPRGPQIIRSFTAGINACIREQLKDPASLPLEFQLLDIRPGYWTPDIVISRHQGLLGNSTDELSMARLVTAIGADKIKELQLFEPGRPDLSLDAGLSADFLQQSLLAPYEAFRAPLTFMPSDIADQRWRAPEAAALVEQAVSLWAWEQNDRERYQITGSNNWVISGKRTRSGKPVLANDPHRAITIPSLRYVVHLEAPGWNVIGGGEPTIPGVSIGHNETAAWGLTIFSIDGEDMMVYDLNPDNLSQYRYKGEWRSFTTIEDTLTVKGAAPVPVTHRFTLHGPVTFIDSARRKAVALRCAWLETGGAPYLASLRMNQAKNWEQFREACRYSHIPGENMVYADQQGNIGWQVVGIAPVRKNWSGLLPVPGDGRFEWDGYLPIRSLPNAYNPSKGYLHTANENNVPEGYPHRNAVGWAWADKFRANRIKEVIESNPRFTAEDAMQLQTDYLSLPARELTPLLGKVTFENGSVAEQFRERLLQWDHRLLTTSAEAALYVLWEKQMSDSLHHLLVPKTAWPLFRTLSLQKTIRLLTGAEPCPVELTGFIKASFELALEKAVQKMGQDPARWQLGSARFKHSQIKHVLSPIVNDSLRILLNTELFPRGGYGNTPGATGSNDNQSHGATFRLVTDLSNWNLTRFTLSPGQSGDPSSPWYKNLFPIWAKDQFLPLLTDEKRYRAAGTAILRLIPD